MRVKRIVTYAAEGKRYINLDCCFTKQIQIKEAHRIASQVEKETKERFAKRLLRFILNLNAPKAATYFLKLFNTFRLSKKLIKMIIMNANKIIAPIAEGIAK